MSTENLEQRTENKEIGLGAQKLGCLLSCVGGGLVGWAVDSALGGDGVKGMIAGSASVAVVSGAREYIFRFASYADNQISKVLPYRN